MGLLALVEHVEAFFQAHDVPAHAVFGERERVKTGNRKSGSIGGRVSFVLVGGDYRGPSFLGPRAGDGDNSVTKAIYQLDCDVEVEIWAWDDSAPGDDAVQFEAWLSLHEWTLNAIRSYAEGRFKPEGVTRDPRGPDLQRGIAYLLSFSYPLPIHQLPERTLVTAAASLTAKQVNPDGAGGATETEIIGDLPITP